MAIIPYRANLGAATFPLIAENFGRSIIISGNDHSYSNLVNSEKDFDKDIGIPQIYYCHNVMPTAEGFQSIGYNTFVAPISPGETEFSEVYELRDPAENRAYFSHTKDGRSFISLYPFYNWIETTTIPASAGVNITVAHVEGESYIYFAGIGCYGYDFVTNTLLPVTLTSLVPTAILGITSAFGYMIAWSSTAVYWSSTTDVTNFNPVAPPENGAGSAAITDAHGKLTTCIQTSYGFLVFTAGNAVAAYFSGNAAYPFNFQEIQSSGGLSDLSLVSHSSNSEELYAYTTAGVQIFSPQRAETVLSDITDFIAGEYFEDFSDTTLTFIRTILYSGMVKKLALISKRYLVFSYGITELTHALVLDLVQNRFGKLKITHTDCFEWEDLSPTLTETPRKSIALLLKTGEVKVVDFDIAHPHTDGTMIIGKFQYIRQRLLTFQQVELENIRNAGVFKLYNMANVQGKETDTPVECTLLDSYKTFRKYVLRQTAINHSLLFRGAFQISSLVCHFSIHGRR